MSNRTGLPTAPFTPASRVRGFGATVFAEFTALANEVGAINLGQGFPNFPAPDFVKQAAIAAVEADLNQYTRSQGHPRLVHALANLYGPLFQRTLNSMTELVVTSGATEGIFATMQALVEPGDEVILIEPFYDSYPAAVIMAGGRPIYVPMHPPVDATTSADWKIDLAALAAAFSPHTRLVVMNTPQNPVGKVFDYSELAAIAALVIEHDAYVLSDEVYEWMVYPGAEHLRMATLPGMWERTITLGSAGKSFSVTGWKIGWAIAPEPLAHAVQMAHQWIPFTVSTPMQEAIGVALESARPEGYFAEMAHMYRQKRDRLAGVLDDVGLRPVTPQGSYFVMVDTSRLRITPAAGELRDVAVCKWLTREIGVAAIPPSPFYSKPHQPLMANLARFCFCKTDETLDEAARRLQRLKSR